jgi:hypothetical protein
MTTEILDKAYLEYSQITKARTQREIQAESLIKSLLNIVRAKSPGLNTINWVISQSEEFLENFNSN